MWRFCSSSSRGSIAWVVITCSLASWGFELQILVGRRVGEAFDVLRRHRRVVAWRLRAAIVLQIVGPVLGHRRCWGPQGRPHFANPGRTVREPREPRLSVLFAEAPRARPHRVLHSTRRRPPRTKGISGFRPRSAEGARRTRGRDDSDDESSCLRILRIQPQGLDGPKSKRSTRAPLTRCNTLARLAPMPSPAMVTELECLRCHAVYDDQRLFTGCPRCAQESVNVNLTVKLSTGAVGPVTPRALTLPPRGLWRFRRLLPLADAAAVSLGEGATPLVHLERLGRRLGLPRLYAKDESQNPTWSYKDRLCSLAVTHAVATGARVITISSTGNHGAATAADAPRAGLPCVIFTLAAVPDTMKTLMQAYGAAVVACPTSEARWTLMREGIERCGW